MSKTIVFIHGMWGTGACWQQYKPVFEAAGYQCYTPTLLMHDVDPKAQPDSRLGTLSISDYVAQLTGFIASLDEPPILIGHSLGGLLAQKLAAKGLAKCAILLTPAAPAGVLALTPSSIKSFWSLQTRYGFWRKAHRPPFKEAVYAMLERVPKSDQQAIYDAMVHESGRVAFEIGYWLLDSKKAAKVDFNALRCPLLIIGATDDHITPASVVRKVAQKYPQALYKEFNNHAHWVIGEPGWQDIANYCLQWLEGTSI